MVPMAALEETKAEPVGRVPAEEAAGGRGRSGRRPGRRPASSPGRGGRGGARAAEGAGRTGPTRRRGGEEGGAMGEEGLPTLARPTRAPAAQKAPRSESFRAGESRARRPAWSRAPGASPGSPTQSPPRPTAAARPPPPSCAFGLGWSRRARELRETRVVICARRAARGELARRSCGASGRGSRGLQKLRRSGGAEARRLCFTLQCLDCAIAVVLGGSDSSNLGNGRDGHTNQLLYSYGDALPWYLRPNRVQHKPASTLHTKKNLLLLI